MPSTMSRTATREAKLERWLALDVGGLLLSHVMDFADEARYPDLEAFDSDDTVLDASLFEELWPNESTPRESPESAEAQLASLRSRLLVSRVLIALSQHPEKLLRLGMEQLEHASRDLAQLAASRPEEAAWVVRRA